MNPSEHGETMELDFSSFKRKIKLTYGLDLEAYKRPQMERRLRANMEKCGARSFVQYYTFMQRDEAVLTDFFDRITINVSELLRNPELFEILRKKVLPELIGRSDSLSIWSAGCSYGAEPYSLAILLDEISDSSRHNILATDIDDKMLVRARMGVFQEAEVNNVSKPRLVKYFDVSGSNYAAKDTLKSKIRFEKHSLLDSRFRTGFDLIVCRNVVIYFTDDTKSVLYRKFFESLRPGGYLFVGGTERISDYADIGFENSFPFFYKKPESQ